MKIKQNNYILGISCFYHDAAATLIRDGKIIAAAQEERFTRIKHDESFPENAIRFCLEEAGISVKDLAYISFYEKPILKFDRIIQTYLKSWPRGLKSFLKSMPIWIKKKLWIKSLILERLAKIEAPSSKKERKKAKAKLENKILFVPHHISHAASSYFTSSFSEATIITIDGVGEKSTTSIATARDNKLQIKKEIHFPHSLGLFYSAFTYYLGFKVNSAEYKVMGLAPYGKPIYKDKILQLIKVYPDGSYQIDMKYFSYEYDLKMVGRKFEKHFGQKRRTPSEDLSQFHKDVAASLQTALEEIVLKIVDFAYQKYPSENLCLSGGVALNCVANGRISRESNFKNLFIFPAAGDAGASAGAALFTYFLEKNKPRLSLENVFLGPRFKASEIGEFLSKRNIPYKKADPQFRAVAKEIANNKIIGFFQGRMEFGPRALGHRSILADPRHQENWQRVNLKIKFRESFRPFAPAVISEKSEEFFHIKKESPYMLFVDYVKNKEIPAVTHVDNSARIQTVSKEQNPCFYEVINSFYEITKCPVLINTSFNVRGEPIVCTYEDAFKCFLRTEMDFLVLENFLIDKKDLPQNLPKEFEFEEFGED